MVWRNSIRALPLLLALPGSALALGLGDIHLRSSLNAPLLAEIDLVGASPEELNGLKATLASRDTFARYGLEYPNYLTSVTLQTARTSDGRDVIQLRSTDTITEPFAILLVEVNWARGRVVREYTMLLDPPVFTNNAANSAAVAPAVSTASAPRSAAIQRPASAPAVAAAPAETASSTAGASAGSTYKVRAGDSLSAIVARAYGSGRVNRDQALTGVYRANAAAFAGNMNELKRGAELRLPAESELAAIAPAEARSEVLAQSGSWKANRPASAGEGRLRLIPPEQSTAADGGASIGTSGSATGGSSPGGTAASSALQQQVSQLQQQLADAKRALELKNAELAALQARAGVPPQAKTPASVAAPPAVTAPPVVQAPPTTAPPVHTAPAASESAAPAAGQTAVPEQSSAPAAEAPKPAPKPAPQPAAPAEDDSILGMLGAYWKYLLGAIVVVLAAVIGMRVIRSRQENLDDSLDRLMPAGSMGNTLSRGGFGDTARSGGVADRESFLVEESGAHEQPAILDRTDENPITARSVTVEDTVSGDTAVALDQGDPLAEADFHMAYGLYDQAADLIRIALAREPGRRDLKLKLLEVFFVWGNKDQFLATARELAANREKAGAGEWEKVVIMGRQIAADDPLFAEGALAGAGKGGVDLNLEGGQNRVDFDLMGEPTLTAHDAPSNGHVDLDIGAALGGETHSAEPSTQTATVAQDAGVDFVLDDPARGSEDDTGVTREMPNEGDAPTVEQPQLRAGDNATIREKLAAPLRQSLQGADQTAEVALDDLGLDLQGVELEGAPDLQAGAEPLGATGANAAPSESGTWLFTDEDLSDLTAIAPLPADAPTQKVNALDVLASAPQSATQQFEAFKNEGVDLDIGNTGATSIRNRGLDLDVGPASLENDAGATARTQKLNSDDIALPDLEPVTMSEVGTKLDLARAYMDMGDPEGARSILDEVLQEGSPSQKQEARRLMDTLPG